MHLILVTFQQDCHDCTNCSIAYPPHCFCIRYCVGRSQVYTSHRLLVVWPLNGYLESTWCRHTKFYQPWVQNYINSNWHAQHSARTEWSMYTPGLGEVEHELWLLCPQAWEECPPQEPPHWHSAAKRDLPCKVMNTTVFNYTVPQGHSQLGVQRCSLSDIFMLYAFMTVALTTHEHAICRIVVNFSTTVVLSAVVLTRVEHGCSPM